MVLIGISIMTNDTDHIVKIKMFIVSFFNFFRDSKYAFDLISWVSYFLIFLSISSYSEN